MLLSCKAIWAEGDERSQKYKVHQYTSTIAFRLGGDHLREMTTKLKPFEGKQTTYDVLNFDDSMTCVYCVPPSSKFK